MTTQIPAPAAAARESARRRDGKFGTQARAEAQLELFPAPVDQLGPSLAKASSAFGEQLSENTWEYLPGEQITTAHAGAQSATGTWTRRPATGGGRLDLSWSSGDQMHQATYSGPNPAATVSDMTASLDRRAGHVVPYRRDDMITDEVAVEVAFGVAPLAYSRTVASPYQRELAAAAYRSSHGEHLPKVRIGRRMSPATLDAAARGCYTDALRAAAAPTAAEALVDAGHPEHNRLSAETWGRCAAAAHFLTRGKGDSSKMADTLYDAVLLDHDADQAWVEVVGYHGEHTNPPHNNTGACTNRPGEPARKPSLLSRLLPR